jgi:hypothetical protein
MLSIRLLAAATGLVLLGTISPAAAPAIASGGAGRAADTAAPSVPTLVAIRAAHHPGYDRLVFEFRGGLPASRQARYVHAVTADGSGRPVRLLGRAFLAIRFTPAVGHDDAGHGTFGPARRAPNLPNLRQVATAGDFEAVLSFGAGLRSRASFRAFALVSPSRVVIDIGA